MSSYPDTDSRARHPIAARERIEFPESARLVEIPNTVLYEWMLNLSDRDLLNYSRYSRQAAAIYGDPVFRREYNRMWPLFSRTVKAALFRPSRFGVTRSRVETVTAAFREFILALSARDMLSTPTWRGRVNTCEIVPADDFFIYAEVEVRSKDGETYSKIVHPVLIKWRLATICPSDDEIECYSPLVIEFQQGGAANGNVIRVDMELGGSQLASDLYQSNSYGEDDYSIEEVAAGDQTVIEALRGPEERFDFPDISAVYYRGKSILPFALKNHPVKPGLTQISREDARAKATKSLYMTFSIKSKLSWRNITDERDD